MAILELITQSTADQLLFNFFLPLILIFTLLWGALTQLGVLNRKVNAVLALAISLLIANSELFVIFSTYVAQLGAYSALAIFAVVFIVGMIFYGFGKGKEIYYESGMPHKKIKNINTEIAKLEKKMAEARDRGDTAKAEAYARTIEKLERELRVESARR